LNDIPDLISVPNYFAQTVNRPIYNGLLNFDYNDE